METNINCEKKNNEPAVFTPVKIEEFDPSTVFDYSNQFDLDKWALRALGELLASSDMDMFSDAGAVADLGRNHRGGLQLLIDLYLDKQEQRVEELGDKVANSPAHILDAAKNFCKHYGGSATVPPGVHGVIPETLHLIEQLISQLGTKQYPEAEGFRDGLVKIVNVIKERS